MQLFTHKCKRNKLKINTFLMHLTNNDIKSIYSIDILKF